MDPFPGYVGLPQTQHPYVYCLNNSINCTDPSGELPPWLQKILAGIGRFFGVGDPQDTQYPHTGQVWREGDYAPAMSYSDPLADPVMAKVYEQFSRSSLSRDYTWGEFYTALQFATVEAGGFNPYDLENLRAIAKSMVQTLEEPGAYEESAELFYVMFFAQNTLLKEAFAREQACYQARLQALVWQFVPDLNTFWRISPDTWVRIPNETYPRMPTSYLDYLHWRDVLDQYDPGSAFSGVYDPSTGQFLIRPSGNTRLKTGERPPDLVQRRGGHGQVNAELGDAGVDTSQTVGFTVFYDAPGELSVAWESGSVNVPNYLNRAAPVEFRQQIMDAIQNATGFKVTSR